MEKENRKIQYWVSFAVALTVMASSASFAWTTTVIPKLHDNETALVVTDTEISWMVVSFSPGIILGNIASQYQSDFLGRRTTLLASAVPFIVGTMFILVFTTKVWPLYLARFCWGFGSGMIKTVSIIYVAEIASKEIRGKLAVGSRFMFNFGNLLVVAIGSLVSYEMLSYLLIVLPVTYFVACWWISETPYYLLKENKVDAARKELKKLNGYKDNEILEQKLMEMQKHVKEDMRRATTAKELFTGKRYRKAIIISFGLRAFHVMSGTMAIQQYLGRIMQDSNSSVSISTGLILFASLKFIASMTSSVIVDRVGRRPLLIFSYIGSFLSFVIIGTCFYIQGAIDTENNSNTLGNVIFSGIIFYNIASTIGYDSLANVIPGEIFPLNVKSIAMTYLNLFGSFVAFISMRGYQIAKDLVDLHGVFCFFGIASILGALFSYYIIPETKGKSLREIQIELQGSLYDVENVDLPTIKTNELKKLMPAHQD